MELGISLSMRLDQPYYYVMNKHGEPVPEPDFLKWAMWFDRNREKRRVAWTEIRAASVSTVFLGLNHGFQGPPVLWETMVFGGVLDEEQVRCSGGREQAEAMHAEMLRAVLAAEETKAVEARKP